MSTSDFTPGDSVLIGCARAGCSEKMSLDFAYESEEPQSPPTEGSFPESWEARMAPSREKALDGPGFVERDVLMFYCPTHRRNLPTKFQAKE